VSSRHVPLGGVAAIVADPAARLAELPGKRKAGYLAVGHVVEADGVSTEQVVRDVVSLARGHAG
jgi:hypothetical protein